MKILELFAGSRSIGKVAESRGHEVFSVDINDFKDIDLVIDILDIQFDNLMKKLFNKGMDNIDMVWASPPCTYFSVASIGHHWNKDHTPKTENALLGVELVQKTLGIINWFPDALFYIENPRGKLRKLPVVEKINRTTVWYCQYGDKRAKPTDIWSNNIYDPLFNSKGWKPKEQCFNGNKNCHHERAPRGSQTGTQGLKGNYERSKIPEALCLEIIKASEIQVKNFH